MENRVRIGVIPAAGAGKRLGYLSGLLPKALFPVYDRPIIHYVVDQMQSIGITDIYIIVNVFKERIINYFELLKMDLRVNIYFIEQPVLNGNAEAILLTEKYINKKPFMVMYGDDCTVSGSLDDMIHKFSKSKATVMEAVIAENDERILQQTCSVKLGVGGKIVEIVEKPERPPYKIRGCGVYLFRPDIYSHIKKTPIHPIKKEREITYTIDMLAKQNKAYAYLLKGHNVNINDYDELLKASQLLKSNRRGGVTVL